MHACTHARACTYTQTYAQEHKTPRKASKVFAVRVIHNAPSSLLACDRAAERNTEAAHYWVAALAYFISHSDSFLESDLFCHQLTFVLLCAGGVQH